MPKWIHRTTKDILNSVPAAELPEPQTSYIEEPDLSGVISQPVKYWKIDGDIVSLLGAPGRAAADRLEADERQNSRRGDAAGKVTDQGSEGMQIRQLIELMNKRDNYIINRLIELQTALQAMKQAGGNANARINLLPDNFIPTQVRNRSAAINEFITDINNGASD